jgi:RNA polymerase sigma-70 factor (ECF subfamily)
MFDDRVEDFGRTRLFEQQRSRLRGIAYRMLGALGDAEDIVQEAFLRWHAADAAAIRSAEAWLVATTTRLAIDRLRSAAAERRAYVGQWLPEPWPGDVDDGVAPDRRLERTADLSVAFLLLLERLTPEERAAFLLREVFEVAYAEIADSLGRSEPACRQLVHRARARLRAGRPRLISSRAEHRRLLERLLQAIEVGDQDRLLALLAPDAALISDGGGKVLSARNVIQGADRVARFLLGVARKTPTLSHEIVLINGTAGVVRREGDEVHSTLSIACDASAVHAVYVMRNPDKLRRIGAAPQAARALCCHNRPVSSVFAREDASSR